MKRVPVTIQFKNNPSAIVAGYALSHEILPKQVSFFAAQKFPVDEELNVFYSLDGEKKSLTVKMKHMHEQISSGRIMNALPTAEVPFTARKFYRCYSFVVISDAITKTSEEENQVEPLAAEAVVDSEPAPAPENTEVVAESMEAAPAAEAAPAPKASTTNAFAADETVSVALEFPEAGDIEPVDLYEPKAA